MRYVPALILDAVLVLIFAAIGRASHDENPAGFLLTAWPFVIALLVGHALAALLPQRPRRPWSLLWGVVVWVVTVAGGMLLRVVSGDTAQVPFIVVATIVLGIFLVGWRALAALMRRRNGIRAAADAGATASVSHLPGVLGSRDESTDHASADDAALDDVPHAAASDDVKDTAAEEAAVGDPVAEDAVAAAESGLEGMQEAIDEADATQDDDGAPQDDGAAPDRDTRA